MHSDPRTAILGVFAHPDDEGSCAACLARYAAEGWRVYVACATRGDGVDAQIKDPAAATRETLGHVRSAELACTCDRLGIEPPLFLGYQDGEVDQVPVEAAAQAVARLIRELRPLVVITHDQGGGYGHPDHIAVHTFATRGFELAGDPAVDLGRPAYAPAKLYYTALPRSYLEKVPAFRDRRAMIRGQTLGFVGVADELITTAVDVHDLVSLKQQALSCHRTQFDIDPQTGQIQSFISSLPEPERSELFGHERFVRARSTISVEAGIETDLLAGLR